MTLHMFCNNSYNIIFISRTFSSIALVRKNRENMDSVYLLVRYVIVCPFYLQKARSTI